MNRFLLPTVLLLFVSGDCHKKDPAPAGCQLTATVDDDIHTYPFAPVGRLTHITLLFTSSLLGIQDTSISVVRLRHLATVLGLILWYLAKVDKLFWLCWIAARPTPVVRRSREVVVP